MVIEAVTGKDFRDVVREDVLVPLSLQDEIFLGLPESQLPRMSYLYEPVTGQPGALQLRPENTDRVWQQAGVPGGTDLMSMLPIVIMFVLLYFLMIRPQMKRAPRSTNSKRPLNKRFASAWSMTVGPNAVN